ncbi:MAG: tRNA (guanosine(37)-N1)-methyltransferase TrmD [Anaerolineae bacterium]|jgi:tRNA (guanine37-N1)-methyltransferase
MSKLSCREARCVQSGSRPTSVHFDVFTLFPEMFQGPLKASILKRALEGGNLSVALHDIRDYATDKHHVTDEPPYGGGGGMVMKAEPIFNAVETVLAESEPSQEAAAGVPVILLTPQGRLFTQEIAEALSNQQRIALVCGRYEGVDERVRQHLATDEISIGDYVLTGGELAAMIIIDAVTRLVPGVLGDPTATIEDSHVRGLLEGPHYTRPRVFRGWEVPEILLSGDHGAVARWRREQALRRTFERRPDLLEQADLSLGDQEFLTQLLEETHE